MSTRSVLRNVLPGALFIVAALALPRSADAGDGCPASVKAAVERAHPGARVKSCKREEEKGKTQFEVKLDDKGGKALEIDLTPDGAILQTEEVVAVSELPAAVTQAYAAKYPGKTAKKAEKQTHADSKITYEIAFDGGKGKKEATFGADGTFVEQE